MEGDDKKLEVYTLTVQLQFATEGSVGALTAAEPPVLIGTLPTTSASNFRYSVKSQRLVFSDHVYPDGNLSAVTEKDEAWENRGTTALVYDQTYVRHWDTWVGPKKASLFSVPLFIDPDHKYHLGTEFANLLNGTGHVSFSDVLWTLTEFTNL